MLDRVGITEGYGSTNTINNAEYYRLVRETCVHIYSLLEEHCGPYATDALIITDNPTSIKDRHYAVFTKDGINIVKSIEYTSPIQRHIQSLIVYIGERVDALSHDGTTTSMMLFTKLVELYMDRIMAAEHDGRTIHRRGMRDALAEELTNLSTAFEKCIITVADFAADFNMSTREATRFVAYHQAMLSSKGDIELSTAIADIVETMPMELYGMFSYTQSGMETDKRFTVTTDDYTFALAVVNNIDYMNHNMNTEYLAEACDLIVCEDGISTNDGTAQVIIDYIGEHRREAFPIELDCENIDIWCPGRMSNDEDPGSCFKNGIAITLINQTNRSENGTWIYNGQLSPLTRPVRKKDIVIIAKTVDSKLRGKIAVINQLCPSKVVVWEMTLPNPYSSKVTVLSALLNTAGVYHLVDHVADKSKPFVIENAKVHYKHRRLFISNLYKKDGSVYHPFFNNPERFEPYTQMVGELKAHIDDVSSGRVRIMKDTDENRYRDYVEIYRRMICAEVRNLQVSGRTHDVLHDRDILQDSFGAVLSSLEKGFVLDGYLKMNVLELARMHNPYTWLPSNVTYTFSMSFQSRDSEVDKRILDNLLFQSLMSVLSSAHRKEEDVIFKTVESSFHYSDSFKYLFFPVDYLLRDLRMLTIDQNDGMGGIFEGGERTMPVTLVMQPADTYRELFKRLGDLLPKLINTNRAIIPGTTHEDEKKK
jgi:hypothetical protein